MCLEVILRNNELLLDSFVLRDLRIKFNPDIFPGLLLGLSGVTVILGVLNIDVELLLPLIGDDVFIFWGRVFDFSLAGEIIFGESGISDKLEFIIELFDTVLFTIFVVELFSLFDEIDAPNGVYILSYRGSHEVVLLSLGFDCFMIELSATSLGLVRSRWPTLASASFELTVEDTGRRNLRSGLNMLISLSLSVKDESPRVGVCSRLMLAFLLFILVGVECNVSPVRRASFSSVVRGR